VAALKRTRRSASVRALTACKLLVLEAADLHHLLECNPAMARRVRHVARLRDRSDEVVRHDAPEGSDDEAPG
jgi:voltage-gated potassium channel